MNDRLTRMLAGAVPAIQKSAADAGIDKCLTAAKEWEASLKKQANIPDPPPQTPFVNDAVGSLLAAQIGNELRGQYEYLAMAAFFKKVGLDGFANYFTKQAGEEAGHAARIIGYLMTTGTEFAMPTVQGPEAGYKTARAAAERYLALETGITRDWLAIYQAADKTDDYAVIKLAQWFADEQITEEDEAVTFYQKVAIAGEGSGLLILDQEYAKR